MSLIVLKDTVIWMGVVIFKKFTNDCNYNELGSMGLY